MNYYQLCPKCQGQGVVSKPPWIASGQTEWTTTTCSFPCDVCNGSKVLFVYDAGPTVNGGKVR